MNINYLLAKEIYGLTPWLVDASSLPILTSILRDAKSGISLEMPEEKCNAISFFNIGQETKVVDRPYGNYYNPGQLDSKENFEAIAVININGPITRSGGMSSFGMDTIANQMRKIAADDRVKGFLIYADSGGGSSSAVEIMIDCINEIKSTKPIYGLIQKGGMACSAMYGILSACSKIYSEYEMSIVGSVGSMMQFEGRKANTESKDGTKNIRIYASKSNRKNKEIEEALNNDNYELIINELLDPINERFLSKVLENRPVLQGSDFDDGNTKFSKDCIGTYIDGIKSFNEVISEVMADYQSNFKNGKTNQNIIINKKTKGKMTQEEIRAQFPEVHSAIFAAGVSSEKDRVGTWMAHSATDPEMVKTGIESGAVITSAQREQLLIKAASATRMTEVTADAAANPAQATAASVVEAVKTEEDEINNFYKDLTK